MNALRFYKNQIIVDRSARTAAKQVVECPACKTKLLVAASRRIALCPACEKKGKVGDASGNFKRSVFGGTIDYRV